MRELDDERAVTSAGRRRGFDALFREHVASVASYCRWRSASLADAEDAVAEVFLIAWRRFDDVPVEDAARPWLYATARRVLANQARAGARRRRLNERLGAEPVATEADHDPRIGRVHDALAALDARDRELLLLVEWEGLTRPRSPRCCTALPSRCGCVFIGRGVVSVRPTKHRLRSRILGRRPSRSC